jgi:hypothetical protein
MPEPTQEQIDNAKRAGWNSDDGEPPEGWDAHGSPPGDDIVDPDQAKQENEEHNK